MALLMPAKRAWKLVLLPVTVASMFTLLGGCGGNTRTSSATATCNSATPILGRTSAKTATAASSCTPSALPSGAQNGSGVQRSPASGIHTLVWQDPATREDGTSLAPNEIGGYRVYYKRVGASSYSVINLTDSTATSLTLSGFSSGTYDFHITAVDTHGLESPPSKTVEVSI